MIVHYEKSRIFEVIAPSSKNIIVTAFPNLFEQSPALLKHLYELWPAAKKRIAKKVREESMTLFESTTYGKLYLITYFLFPKVKDITGVLRETQANKKYTIEFVDLCISYIPETEELIYVNISSLSSIIVDEKDWLSYFASHKRSFAIYH